MLVGDDEAFLAEAAAIAARELGCRIFAGRAKYELPQHDQQAFDSLPLSARCAATLHLLTDLELLAHTDYFVGARRAPAGRLRALCTCSPTWRVSRSPVKTGRASLCMPDDIGLILPSVLHAFEVPSLTSGSVQSCPSLFSGTAYQAWGRGCNPVPSGSTQQQSWSCARARCRSGSFNSGLAHLVDKLRYVMYGKHRRTTIDASASAHPLPLHSPLAAVDWQTFHLLHYV